MESQLAKLPILPITVKLLFTNSFSYYYRHGWYYTLFTSNYWKQAMTPWFIRCYWKDATTPYLPMPIGRRIPPLGLSVGTERMLQHPILLAMIDRMLLHPIYQFLLEGGNNPLQACFLPECRLATLLCYSRLLSHWILSHPFVSDSDNTIRTAETSFFLTQAVT